MVLAKRVVNNSEERRIVIHVGHVSNICFIHPDGLEHAIDAFLGSSEQLLRLINASLRQRAVNSHFSRFLLVA